MRTYLLIKLTCPTHHVYLAQPYLEDVRGETTRKKAESVKERKVAIPKAVVERLKYLTMAADVFFIDRIPFLITMSRVLQFITAEFTASRTAPRLAERLKKVLRVYIRAGYLVRYVFMDGEFEKIKPFMPDVICKLLLLMNMLLT